MSPLFGSKDPAEAPAGEAELEAELERIGSLSLEELALEVMVKGFGPGGPGEDPEEAVTAAGMDYQAGPGLDGIATAVARDFYARATKVGANERVAFQHRLCRLLVEGLQVLEHASLIREQFHGKAGVDYALTRLGRSALERGAVERIIGGGEL